MIKNINKVVSLDLIMNAPQIRLGEWRYSIFPCNNDKNPFPIPNLFKLDQNNLISKLKFVMFNYGWPERYFSILRCRLCNYKCYHVAYLVKYKEFTYIIPLDYIHYLENHNIKIDNKLVEIINYYFDES